MVAEGPQPEFEENSEVEGLINESSEPIEKIEDKGTNSTPRAFILIIKSYVGSGVMGLPFAFLQGGVWPGIVTIIGVAVISAYCINLLIKIKDRLRRDNKSLSTFGEIGAACLGRVGYFLVQFSLIFTQLGFSTAYLIFTGQNMNHLIPKISSFWWTWIVSPLFIAVCLIRQWKWLAPFSLVGYAAIMFGLGVVMEHCFGVEHFYEHITWAKVNRVPLESMPIFFGIAVYIFEGIGLVIDMEKAMKKPHLFQYCQNGAYVILLITFIFVGCVGYLTYGTDTNSIIILNLPENPLTDAVIGLMMLALYTSYPVQMFPVFSIVENYLFKPKTYMLEMKRNLLRVFIVILTVLIAVGIPHFGLFMSLVGSVGGSLLAFILPTIFYTKLFWGEQHPVRLTANILILLFGIAASGISTTVTVIQIIEELRK